VQFFAQVAGRSSAPGGCRPEAPLGRREILADLVLGVLPSKDAGHVHDPGQDRLLLQDVPDGPQAALAEHEFKAVGHADGLEQSFTSDAVGQGREVAHVPAVAGANLDVGDLEFFEHVCRYS
jgi:hypothetical protein